MTLVYQMIRGCETKVNITIIQYIIIIREAHNKEQYISVYSHTYYQII